MKKLLLIVFVILCHNMILSQVQDSTRDLTGYVISVINNKPILECLVTIKGSTISEITDNAGRFEFNKLTLNHKYTLSLHTIGYDVFDTTITLSAYTKNNIVIKLNTECSFDSFKAREDIKNGQPKLLIVGGIAPLAETTKDIDFENKYEIEYYDFGCTPPAAACIEDYNKIIFKYLTEKYGDNWKKTVRKDVCFLNY